MCIQKIIVQLYIKKYFIAIETNKIVSQGFNQCTVSLLHFTISTSGNFCNFIFAIFFYTY